jgi:hypothetical protein
MAKVYKVWIHIEECDEENDKYTDLDCIELGAFDTKRKAIACVDRVTKPKDIYVCSRYMGDGKLAYVSSLPGEGGVDWGYHSARSEAKKMSTYWARRFAKYMERCGGRRVFQTLVDENDRNN